MKIKFIPTGNAPDYFTFYGDIVTAHHNGVSEDFNFVGFEPTDSFTGLRVDSLDIPWRQIIREASRDESGELHVTLCQRTGAGHWAEGPEIDSDDYSPENINVVYTDKPHSGVACAYTKKGKMEIK